MTAMDTIVAAYDLADEEGVGPADPLRLLPLAASQAVRDDLVVSVEDWFQVHDGDRVATLRLGGVTRVIASRYPVCRMEAHERYARFSCMEAPVRSQSFWNLERVGASADWRTLVVQQEPTEDLLIFTHWPDGYPLCHPTNPWCDYSEEALAPRDMEAGPYRTICTIHHGKEEQSCRL